MSKLSIKNVEGNRLVWYMESADADHWHRIFAPQIATSLERPGRAALRLARQLAVVLPKAGKVLEAGCGTGRMVAALLREGIDIEGVDYSERLIAEVLAYKPDLPVRAADVCQLDVPDHTYSGYVSLGVIEHRYAGPEPFLQEAYRVVKPGGTVCISVPYFNFVRRAKAFLGSYRQDVGDLAFYQYGFSKREFLSILTASGFIFEHYLYYGTARIFQEELGLLPSFVFRRRLLRRLPQLLDLFDDLGLTHMMMIVARKPA
jgi:SAM-dependent methyltransferase